MQTNYFPKNRRSALLLREKKNKTLSCFVFDDISSLKKQATAAGHLLTYVEQKQRLTHAVVSLKGPDKNTMLNTQRREEEADPTGDDARVDVERVVDGVNGARPVVPLAEGERASVCADAQHVCVASQRDPG